MKSQYAKYYAKYKQSRSKGKVPDEKIMAHLELDDWTTQMAANDLLFAIKKGHYNVVRFYVEKGVFQNARDRQCRTGLMYLVEHQKHPEVIDYLLKQRPAIYASDNSFRNILILAVIKNDQKIIQKLFSNKYIEPNDSIFIHSDIVGNTPLHIASINGKLDLVKLIIENSNEKSWSYPNIKGQTSIMLATQCEHHDVVEYLSNKVDLTVKDLQDRTCLILAAELNDMKIVKMLVKKNRDIMNAKNWYGLNCLMTAAQNDYSEMVEFFINEGMPMEDKDNQNRTSLMLAAKKGNHDTVKYLIENGANTSLTDDSNTTCFELAISSRNIKLIKYMMNSKKVKWYPACIKYATAKHGGVELFDLLVTHNNKPLDVQTYRQLALIAKKNKQIDLLNHILAKDPKRPINTGGRNTDKFRFLDRQ